MLSNAVYSSECLIDRNIILEIDWIYGKQKLKVDFHILKEKYKDNQTEEGSSE